MIEHRKHWNKGFYLIWVAAFLLVLVGTEVYKRYCT